MNRSLALRRIRRSLAAFLKAHNLDADHPYVIVAGAALYLHGLRDSFDDLDVIVPNLGDHVVEEFEGLTIDAHETLLGNVGLARAAIASSFAIEDGLRVQGLESLRELKYRLCRELKRDELKRAKDQHDLAAIDRQLFPGWT
jgi:predicted metallo-beta-lactamase superfamily hydrolase